MRVKHKELTAIHFPGSHDKTEKIVIYNKEEPVFVIRIGLNGAWGDGLILEIAGEDTE